MTLLAIVAIHTAANEPPKVRQVMNKIHRNVAYLYPPPSAQPDSLASHVDPSARPARGTDAQFLLSINAQGR